MHTDLSQSKSPVGPVRRHSKRLHRVRSFRIEKSKWQVERIENGRKCQMLLQSADNIGASGAFRVRRNL